MDTRLGADKRCPVTEMPTAKNSECRVEVGTCINGKLLKSGKGQFALTVDLFILISVVTVLLLIEFGIFPHHQGGFYCNDKKLSFQFTGDTISISVLLSSVYIIPLVVIGAVEWKTCRRKELCKKIWLWYKDYLLGITIMLVLIEFIKVIVGEPRPHFFDTCQPNTAANCTAERYITSYTCTNTKDKPWLVSDSSKSFPSGHAAMGIFAGVFCAVYLQRCFPILLCKLLKPLLQTTFLVASAVCSLTRITDNRHHWWDVLAGSILGIICVYYTITVLCRNFQRPFPSQPRPSQSTCTLLTDTTNKNATSVVL